jgi:DNA repair ATPase RecN
MLNQNPNLYLLRHALSQLCDVVDRLIEQDSRLSDIEQKNGIRDSRISNLEHKYKEMIQRLDKHDAQFKKNNTQLQDCQNSVNSLEDKIPHLAYLEDRNAELECWADPYSPDGDAICNS